MRDDSSTPVLDRAEPAAIEPMPVPTVAALPYTQLRLLAECAVVNDNKMDFYFQRSTKLFSGLAAGPSADTDVAAYTEDRGRHPANHVTLEALYYGKTLRLELKTRTDDAVFWSDAAVQKFVFPYVASCGGDQGGAMLQTLQDAWNGYPAEQVTVYALVQQSRFTPDAEISLDLAIQVVYVAHPDSQSAPPPEPALEIMTLRAFGRKYPPVTPKLQLPPQQAPYLRGIGGVRQPQQQRPGYTTLRAMAEWACSLSKQPEYFVFRAGKVGFDTPLPTILPALGPGDWMVPAMTPTVPASRPTLASVVLQPKGSKIPSDNLTVKADALFWSTGCIEQFLFPYYASKTGFAGMSELVEMIYAWTGHMPVLSQNPAVNGEADVLLRDGAPDGTSEAQVAGLIHLHTSEWIETTADGRAIPRRTERVELTRQLGVVSVGRRGKPYVERLDRFIVRKRAGR